MTKSTRQDLPAPLTEDASPADVASCDDLSTSQRLDILRSWREDQLAELRAQSEGMDTGNRSETPTHDASALVAEIESQIDRLESA